MTAMTTHSYILTEYEPARPWMVVSTGRSSVELPEGDSFEDWANETYPDRQRFKVREDRDPFRWAALD